MPRLRSILLLLFLAAIVLGACQYAPLPIAPPIPATMESPPRPPETTNPISLHEFTSEALAGNLLGDPVTRPFVIYLPPSYGTGEMSYPVVYALHGFTGDQWMMSTFMTLVDDMIRSGDAPEMIVVMPNASNAFRGSFYMTSPTIGDYETYITDELVTWIDTHYRTLAQPSSRGLTGCSMGGLGAVRLGLKYPEVYGVVAGVSGPYLQEHHLLLKLALVQIETIPLTFDELVQQPFPVQAVFALAAATASNPEKPPFYLDIPFAELDGKIQFVEEVYERMSAGYADSVLTGEPGPDALRQSVLLYHGNQDPLAGVEGATVLAEMLGERSMNYEYLAIDGGHCDLDYVPVVEFFAKNLTFEPAD